MNNVLYTESQINDVTTDINMNAYDFIDKNSKSYGNLTALTYFGNKIKYNDFKQKVNLYANRLMNYGLQKGDRFTLVLPNTPEIVYYYYAAWVLGCVICPIDPRTNPNGILDMINNTKSKIVISVLDKYSEKIVPIMDKMCAEKVIIVSPTDSMGTSLKEDFGKLVYKYKEFYLNLKDKDFASDKVIMNTTFLKGTTNNPIKSVYDPTELGMPAACMFTSGTEGTPKAAVHSHEAFNAKAKQILYALPKAKPGDKFLGIIPFFSAYGAFSGMHNCLFRGMNIDLIPKFNPNKFPELVCEHQPSTVIAVPNYWHDFSQRIDELMVKYKLEDLLFLMYPISGGDKQPSKDITACNSVFKKYDSEAILIRGYGSTEVGGATLLTSTDDKYEDNEYSGFEFPGVDTIIAEDGELLVHDPAIMMEYLDNKKETDESIKVIDGKRYMKMGDYFIKKEDESNKEPSRYIFNGRKKRAYMRPDGHTVHALPIEEAIEKSDLVNQVCVVGLAKKDGSSGTIPTAFVVLNDGVNEQIAVKELDKISLENLSERNRALGYVFIDELPRTLMDKVDFKKLEQNFIEDVNVIMVDETFYKNNNKTLKLNK